MLANKIDSVLEDFQKDSSAIIDLKILEEIRIKYLGKNGLVINLFEELKSVPKEEKPSLGKSLNSLRDQITSKITELKQNLTLQLEKEKSYVDLSLPGRHKQLGSNHLLTQTLNEIKLIFRSLGFSSIEGPELESDYYNFEALNFPKDHPARDMQDTFFISKDFVLRTHTTPVQVRIMEKQQPPVRAIMPGRVYRNEAVSSRSYCMFHQVDGIYVERRPVLMDGDPARTNTSRLLPSVVAGFSTTGKWPDVLIASNPATNGVADGSICDCSNTVAALLFC